ncbi:MAG: LysR family transcriptional regulator [Lachnospiraceae bacterium]
MNQRHLEYFLEVFRTRSMKTAADNLFISPQAMSKTILALEEELGETLFDRSGKTLLPTPAAVTLKTHAQKILDEFKLIKNKDYLSAEKRTRLKVLSSADVLQYLTVDFAKDFQQAHPEILLVITETTDRMAEQMLLEGDAELALINGPQNHHVFDMNFIFSAKYVTVIHKQHPLAQKMEIEYKDLDLEPIAWRGREFGLFDRHKEIMDAHGVTPIPVIETSSYFLIHRMVEANLCLGSSLDYIAFADQQPNTVIRPFADDQMTKYIYLINKKQMPLSKEASIFQSFLLEWKDAHKNTLFHW